VTTCCAPAVSGTPRCGEDGVFHHFATAAVPAHFHIVRTSFATHTLTSARTPPLSHTAFALTHLPTPHLCAHHGRHLRTPPRLFATFLRFVFGVNVSGPASGWRGVSDGSHQRTNIGISSSGANRHKLVANGGRRVVNKMTAWCRGGGIPQALTK